MDNSIKSNFQQIKESVPSDINIVVAAKTRGVEEVKAVIEAGSSIIGENYVQEAKRIREELGELAVDVKWHMIGHLQTNKVKAAVKIFDMIETLDSVKLAQEIDKRCREINKVMPVLVEINAARESQKTGIFPRECLEFIKSVSGFLSIKVMGLMTMGPQFGDPEEARKYFKEVKAVFDKIKEIDFPNVNMKHLSMGMSNTYRVAIEEGSNMIRPGTVIFGKRESE
ncbi:MAG: YggS family pyridoxal phosphate-dependent enzyme [Candidatus Omnitrophica bacterium]|nr:YggS family pyridoxal phosphate-dependent enzyme [Candidatus Omnitrophota bacterium]